MLFDAISNKEATYEDKRKNKRFLMRENTSERHQGLVSNGAFDDFETFTKLSEKCREFKINDNELIVYT